MTTADLSLRKMTAAQDSCTIDVSMAERYFCIKYVVMLHVIRGSWFASESNACKAFF